MTNDLEYLEDKHKIIPYWEYESYAVYDYEEHGACCICNEHQWTPSQKKWYLKTFEWEDDQSFEWSFHPNHPKAKNNKKGNNKNKNNNNNSDDNNNLIDFDISNHTFYSLMVFKDWQNPILQQHLLDADPTTGKEYYTAIFNYLVDNMHHKSCPIDTVYGICISGTSGAKVNLSIYIYT